MRASNKHIFILIVALIFISVKTYAQEVRVVDNKGTIQKVNNNRVYTSATDPNTVTFTPLENDIWFDITTTPNIVKIWDNTTNDWKVVNDNAPHTGTAGSLFFAGATGVPDQDNSELFWDTTNNNLHIGALLTGRDSNKLNVRGTVRASGYKAGTNTDNGTANRPSYTFFNDVNTGMYRGTNVDELNFSTGGTNALSIDASQNISIPQNLSVTGTYADTSGDTGTTGQILSSIGAGAGTNWINNPALSNWLTTGNSGTNPTTNFLGTTDAQDLVLRAGNIEKLRITNNIGQVRINQALIYGNHPLVIRANGPDILAFQDNTGTTRWHWNFFGNTGLNFVETGVADYRLFLEDGGNIGINIGNPTEKLDINGKLRVRDIATVTTNNQILTADTDGVVQKKVLVDAQANNSISNGANGGVYYNSPIKAMGKIAANGTETKITAGYTVTKTGLGTGRYRVNIPVAFQTDANYIIQLTAFAVGNGNNDYIVISYYDQTVSDFKIEIKNYNGNRRDKPFMFTILNF